MTQPAKPHQGNPGSAQPIKGLSERAKAMLKPRSLHYRHLAIAPAGDGIAQQHKRKARI